MQCVRCQGLMVMDSFMDLAETGASEFRGWRCLMCGHITDPVIRANREHPPVVKPPLRKRSFAV